MPNCTHQKVCKHFSEDEIMECSLQEVCKHHAKDYDTETAETKPIVSTRKKAKGDGEDLLPLFKKAKVYVALHKKDLDENQKEAVDAMTGKHYSGLSEEQRKQMIEIAAYLKRAVDAKD